MADTIDWTKQLESLRTGVLAIEQAQATLAELHDRATADIVKYLRAESGIELDLDAIRATLTRPYTLIPINETEARLVHWRGVKLPIFGWVERQEPAFTVARGSRTQEAQRLGRLLHGQQKGEHYLLFTPEEAARYRNRLLGVESELLGEVDIEYELVGNVAEPKEREVRVKPSRKAVAVASTKPQSEIDLMLNNPAVRKLIDQADIKVGVKATGYIEKVIRLAWDSPVSLEEIRAGRGIGEEGMKRYRAGFREAQEVGLVTDLGGGRYLADRAKIKKLVELSQRFAK